MVTQHNQFRKTRSSDPLNSGSCKKTVLSKMYLKIFRLYKNSATYWEGKADQESLQRVYGITFPDKKRLTEWAFIQEEAKKRDHRRIGVDQELWYFDPLSAGSCFWLPRGTIIYNRLVDYMKAVSNLLIIFKEY